MRRVGVDVRGHRESEIETRCHGQRSVADASNADGGTAGDMTTHGSVRVRDRLALGGAAELLGVL